MKRGWLIFLGILLFPMLWILLIIPLGAFWVIFWPLFLFSSLPAFFNLFLFILWVIFIVTGVMLLVNHRGKKRNSFVREV